jgi:hypothetical protein
MIQRLLLSISFIIFLSNCASTQPMLTTSSDWTTPFEKNTNYTPTHSEVIAYYERLSKAFPNQFKFKVSGKTDVGRPLHTGILSNDGDFTAKGNKAKKKCILLINNAIHPGEPTGVDATMLLIRDFLTKKEMKPYLEHLTIVFIPMYNVGGALNRGSFSRANQEGPEEHGFRGNVRNYDLNRDFIKCDTKNAQSFNQIFTEWRPHVFVDNHTSNGADYQYVMTLIPTQHNKLQPILSSYLKEKMLPRLFQEMAKTDYEMTPYVYARTTPDDGIMGFLDLPRYSSGYAALFNTLSFMPEAHMLKSYEQRVKGTYSFMESMLKLIKDDHETIIANKAAADKATQSQTTFDLNWTLDKEQKEGVNFKGFAAKYKPSKVSGKDRLYYDRNEPYTKKIPFWNTYKSTTSIEKPKAYIIPQGYEKVIERLRWNGVKMVQLIRDEVKEIEMYYIKDYKTGKSPYEGHFLHKEVTIEKRVQKVQYYKGDYLVKTNQAENNYIMHTLEPMSADAFFAWNFFDAILQQKEYFSPYVFEEVAAALLEKDADLKARFEAKKKADEKFAESAYDQLLFIYRNSPHYEMTHNRYPVGRVL